MGGEDNEKEARKQLIDIVLKAGEGGFLTLVRALAKSYQTDLASQLDDALAKMYAVRRPAVAGMSSL